MNSGMLILSFAVTLREQEDLSERLDAIQEAVYATDMEALSDSVDAVHGSLPLSTDDSLANWGRNEVSLPTCRLTLKESSNKVYP